MIIIILSQKDLNVFKASTIKNKKESWSGIHYILVPKGVYVFPTQVLSPLVNMDENNVLKMDEYQWLCNSI